MKFDEELLATWTRLCWHYGAHRADRIMAGLDPATQAAIARWQALGRRRIA